MLRTFLTGFLRAPDFGVRDWLSAGPFLASGASPEVAERDARRVSLCAVVGRLCAGLGATRWHVAAGGGVRTLEVVGVAYIGGGGQVKVV